MPKKIHLALSESGARKSRINHKTKPARNPKPRQPSVDRRADALLSFVKEQSKSAKTWTELSNRVFGIGGKAGELFPKQSERTALVKLPQFRQITELIRRLPEGPVMKAATHTVLSERPPSDYSGKLVVRLPKSVHAALAAEAVAENVSLNQLILAKLTIQLRGAVQV